MRALTGSLLIIAYTLLADCQGGRGALNSLGELREVQRRVVAAEHFEDVTVNLNNGHDLTVGMINSPWTTLSSSQKNAKAREIAAVAYKAFRSRSTLDSVAVAFVVRRTYLLFFNYTHATDYHSFTAAELAAGEAASD